MNKFLFIVTCFFLSMHIQTVDVSDLEKERVTKQKKDLKRDTAIGTGVITSLAALYLFRQQNSNVLQKRFIATAATTGASLAWSLTQSTAGCFALGVAYYKIRLFLYDGYAKEKHVQRLEDDFESCKKTVSKSTNELIERVNNHETIIQNLSHTVALHAIDLNVGRGIARDATARINQLSGHAPQNNSEPLGAMSLPDGIDNPAAQPQDRPRQTIPIPPIQHKINSQKSRCC